MATAADTWLPQKQLSRQAGFGGRSAQAATICDVPTLGEGGTEEAFVAQLLDESIVLCRSVLEGSWNVAWKAGRLRLALMETEHGSLQKQLAAIESRPQDMKLACDYHRRCSRYDEDRSQIMRLSAMLETERSRWLHTSPTPAWAPAAPPPRAAPAPQPVAAAVATSRRAVAAPPPSPLPQASPPPVLPPTLPQQRPLDAAKPKSLPQPPPQRLLSVPTRRKEASGAAGLTTAAVVPPHSVSPGGILGGSSDGGGGSSGYAGAQRPDGMWTPGPLAGNRCAPLVEEQAASAGSTVSPTPPDSAGDDAAEASGGGPERGCDAGVVEALGQQELLQNVQQHLDAKVALCSLVAHVFAEFSTGGPLLNFAGLQQAAAALARHMCVSEKAAFGNVEDEYVRFDFNGDGTLQEHEFLRLVRYHLREYRKQLGHVLHEVDVPYASMEERGYRIVRHLGAGSQGACHLAALPSGIEHCIKILRKSNIMTKLDELKDEIDTLSHVHNEHIIKIFSIFQDAENFYLVTQPYFGSDFTELQEHATQQGIAMTERWWRGIFRQCFGGLLYMHQHALMHCDIKEPNVMLKSKDMHKPEVVFIDFGLAQEFAHAQVVLCGTPGYIPPETWRMHKWFPKGDVFCMGVCMLQLLSGRPGIFTEGARPPPRAFEDVEAFTLSRPAPLHLLPQELRAVEGLLCSLLAKNMRERITAFQALEHPWFQTGSPGATPPPLTSSPSSSPWPSPPQLAGMCANLAPPPPPPPPAVVSAAVATAAVMSAQADTQCLRTAGEASPRSAPPPTCAGGDDGGSGVGLSPSGGTTCRLDAPLTSTTSFEGKVVADYGATAVRALPLA